MRRFVSSGRHSSKQRLPASIWKMGMCRRFALMAERQLLVSPKISRASGFSFTIRGVASGNDVADGFAKVGAHGVQIMVRRAQAKVLKKYLVQRVIVILARVHQKLVKVYVAFFLITAERRMISGLVPTMVISFSLLIAVLFLQKVYFYKIITKGVVCFHTCPAQVSGFCGSNGSLAHMTVTSSPWPTFSMLCT